MANYLRLEVSGSPTPSAATAVPTAATALQVARARQLRMVQFCTTVNSVTLSIRYTLHHPARCVSCEVGVLLTLLLSSSSLHRPMCRRCTWAPHCC